MGVEGNKNDREKRLRDLMVLAQSGDDMAYRLLLAEVERLVGAFVTKRLSANSAVDDVVQDVLLSIHRARHTYNPARPFGPWMYAIARNRLYDFLRKSMRISKAEVSDETAPDHFIEDRDVSFEAMVDEVKMALEELPEKQREIITLMKLESYSVQEIAEKMSMSVSAVKVTAHRGYKSLRKKFDV